MGRSVKPVEDRTISVTSTINVSLLHHVEELARRFHVTRSRMISDLLKDGLSCWEVAPKLLVTEEWIVKHERNMSGHMEERFYCSSCGTYQTYGPTPYCPFCGKPLKVRESNAETTSND